MPIQNSATTSSAPPPPPAAAADTPKESRHRKEKKEKSHAHRSREQHSHSHSKKARQSEPVSAAAVLTDEEEDWDENRAAVERLCAQYPNNICCDCGESGTRWASVNHGVFVCIRCSGVHRSLGTHVSKVKSTNMDRWSLAEVRLMEAIGNTKAKTLYEARLPAGTRPALSSSNSGVADDGLKLFIRRKYVDREFAMHNLKDVRGRLYKDTGYGRPPKKQPRSSGTALPFAASSHHMEPPLDRAAITGKRGDTMRALYGDNAEEMQRGAAKHKRGGGGASAVNTDASMVAPKPTYGAFGLVNVPAEEYDERWRRTLEVFAHVAAPAEADTLHQEEGANEGEGRVPPPPAAGAPTTGAADNGDEEEKRERTAEAGGDAPIPPTASAS
jgi:hypothetical protein